MINPKIKKILMTVFGQRVYSFFSKTYSFFRNKRLLRKKFFRNKHNLFGVFVNKRKKINLEGFEFNIPHYSPLYFFGEKLKSYELSERTMVKKYVEKTDSVLELGGCLGIISCFTNKILDDKKKHVVVEPNEDLIFFIENNKINNDCGFIVEKTILSNKLKKIEFYKMENYHGSSIIKPLNVDVKGDLVKCMSLENLMRKHNIFFNTLIMDIEGNEYEFLDENDLSSFEKLIIEFHPHLLKLKMKKCYQNLSKKGFERKEKINNVEVWIKKT
jgi:FkbM family methyltransferase